MMDDVVHDKGPEDGDFGHSHQHLSVVLKRPRLEQNLIARTFECRACILHVLVKHLEQLSGRLDLTRLLEWNAAGRKIEGILVDREDGPNRDVSQMSGQFPKRYGFRMRSPSKLVIRSTFQSLSGARHFAVE